MSFNGSGTFNINTAGQPVVSGTVISSTAFNALTADLATGLSTCITKDGQTTVSANIPMNSFKFTGLAAGTAATDSARVGQLQAGGATVVTVSGTDTYTGTMSPALSAYAAGNTFTFVVPNTNTTSCTLNIDGLGAKALTRDGSTALVAGDLVAGSEVAVVYDGTRFQVLNSNSKTNWTVSGTNTLSGGTANGVAYLNGSKVVTTGSALTFDGTNFATTGTASATKFIPTGGTATGNGMYLPAANTLGWSTNGTQAMTLDALGNFGVGTAAPSGAAGYTYVSLNNSTNGTALTFRHNDAERSALFYSTANNIFYLLANYAGNQIDFGTGGTSGRMRIDASGNVGIGTTTPGATLSGDKVLEVRSAGTTRIESNSTGRYGVFNLGAGASANNTYGWMLVDDTSNVMNISSGTNTPMEFGTYGTVRMRLDTSGNLGIGVTPSTWVGTGNQRAIQISTVGSISSLSNATGNQQLNLGRNAYDFYGAKYLTSDTASAFRMLGDNTFAWYQAPSGTAGNAISFTQAMTLDASGRLGIGTSSPTVPLDVVISGTGSNNIISARTTGASGQGLLIGIDTTNAVTFIKNNTTSNYGISFWSGNGAEGMRLDSSGNLLVGTTSLTSASISTSSTLQVKNEFISVGANAGIFWENRSGGVTSNSNWYGWYTASGTIYIYNGSANAASINASTGAYTALSDVNKKKDFESSSIGLDAVLALKPTLYRMIDDEPTADKQLGFIAQEVKPIIPQAYVETHNVDAGGKDNVFIGLNDRAIIAALVKAVQELTARVAALEGAK